jgi:hypothetical protein
LIEGREDIVAELNFCDCGMASNCQADGEAQNSLLGKWSIEYSVDSIAFAKSMSAAENASEFDIFSKNFGTEWDVRYV